MKIAVWLSDYLKPSIGGGFSYTDRLINSIDTYSFCPEVEIVFLTTNKDFEHRFNKPLIILNEPSQKNHLHFLCNIPLVGKFFFHHYHHDDYKRKIDFYHKQISDNDIRIIYYLNPETPLFDDIPFISTHWDIGHISTFPFPETTSNGEFNVRENIYKNILPRAMMIFCESDYGRNELIQYTNLNPQRVRTVPIFPGECVTLIESYEKQCETLDKYGLTKNKYFFYPAQFWAHKNHYTVINGFSLFLKKYPDYKLVLTGSDKGNLNYIKEQVKVAGIENKICFPGFVTNEIINTLFLNATALVFASIMGPSNMPPLEAMELNCPIIISNIEGHRKMFGESVLYFMPLDPYSLNDAMRRMIEERPIWQEKIKDEMLKSQFNIESALRCIDHNLKEAVTIRNLWGE